MFLDHDRVLITRLDTNTPWRIIVNPTACHVSRGLSMVLDNECNDYAEYTNIGHVTRMIRYKDLKVYDINPNDLSLEHAMKKGCLEIQKGGDKQ